MSRWDLGVVETIIENLTVYCLTAFEGDSPQNERFYILRAAHSILLNAVKLSSSEYTETQNHICSSGI